MAVRLTPLGAIWLAILLAIGIIVAAPPAQAQENVSQSDARKQLLESKRELNAARAREKIIAAELEELAQDRAGLNKTLIATAARIQASEANLSKIESRMADLSSQEEQVRGSIAARHATITKLLAAMQRIGRQPPPALVTRRDDALKMVRSAMLMASLFPELKIQAERLSKELDDLVRFGEGITLQRDKLKTENEKLILDSGRISALIARKKTLAVSRAANLAKIRKAAARHASTVNHLDELLQRMDKEIAAAGLAKYEAELAAAKNLERERTVIELKPSDRTRVALLSPARLKPALPFPETRGKLARPVSGREIRSFGGKNKFGERARGMLIAARPNAQVTSPVDGWVAYADEFRTYGQLLIINAGGGYHILLAGMRRIDVGEGQFVLAGEPVAVMGGKTRAGSGQAAGPRQALYIEFRKDGRSIDPSPWWAKSSERVQG